MRILFDQGTPVPLRRWLAAHEVATAWQRGWAQLSNGDLLAAAEAAGFDLLVTTDQNLRYQQNLSARRIAILVLTVANWPALELHAAEVAAAVDAMPPGAYREWLETNGLGGYAMSTVTGENTRRYHGLLVAATKPPVGRMVLLSKLEETLVVNGRRIDLSTNRFPGVTHPEGDEADA